MGLRVRTYEKVGDDVLAHPKRIAAMRACGILPATALGANENRRPAFAVQAPGSPGLVDRLEAGA
ncbi:MAG: hypothetical protein HYV63_00270 [Candidatus Schekmanbacteria bacterium]|nr:hypothetical protein [Candidatus Schekmanbacteria bacterium]